MVVRVVRDRISGNDPVVIVRKTLRFHQRLPPTRGASVEIRVLWILAIKRGRNPLANDGHQMNCAISEIDNLLRMSQRKRSVRGGSNVSGVGAGGGVPELDTRR